MLISVCTPVMNRTDDLRRTMSARIEAAMESPPIEFVILNYNSTDDLREFVVGELERHCSAVGIDLTYREYRKGEHYHQAHAYNLAILAGHGEWFCLMHADSYPIGGYFTKVRELVAQGYDWIEPPRYKGAIACRRSEFEKAGGFDERFEFYGPDDKELAERLTRRGLVKAVLPDGLVGNIPTPDRTKMANYRNKMTKSESSALMRVYLHENRRKELLKANPKGWGRW